jgi:hypothetical protein
MRLQPLGGGEGVDVRAFWSAPTGNSAMPGVSYFALIPSSAGLRVGDRARASAGTADATKGVLVPAAAIVLKGGAVWCFIEIAPGKYERRAVDLSRPAGEGYIVTNGLNAGDKAVVSGAALLLAREAVAEDTDKDKDKAGDEKPPAGEAPATADDAHRQATGVEHGKP